MNTADPNEAIQSIQAKADEFAAGDADDPKALVDGVMADIEAALDQIGADASGYLEQVDGETKTTLATAEADKGGHPHLQRRVRFLRSIAQLLDARRTVGS